MPNYIMNRITINTDEKTMIKILKAIKNDSQLKATWPEDYKTMRETELVTAHTTIDFNKVIPMPESLKIESGTTTDKALDWWLWANRRELDAGERFEPALSDNNYIKVLYYPRYGSSFYEKTKTKEGIAELEKYNKDIKIQEMGMKAAHNIIDYDTPTWYEWCCHNWGTKWNSCEARGSAGKYDINFTTAWSPVYPIAQKLSKQYPGIIVSISGADECAPFMFPTVMYINGEEIMRHKEEDNEESWGDLWGYGCEDEEEWLEDEDDESEDKEDKEEGEGVLALDKLLDKIDDPYTR